MCFTFRRVLSLRWHVALMTKILLLLQQGWKWNKEMFHTRLPSKKIHPLLSGATSLLFSPFSCYTSVCLVVWHVSFYGVCLCSSQGLVVVWELQLERRGRPERVSLSWEHRGQAITALCWDTSTLRVFVGDSGGKVSFLRAGSSKLGKVVTAD